MKYLLSVVHTHGEGASLYTALLDKHPKTIAEETLVSMFDIDFEPDREESLEQFVEPLADIPALKVVKAGFVRSGKALALSYDPKLVVHAIRQLPILLRLLHKARRWVRAAYAPCFPNREVAKMCPLWSEIGDAIKKAEKCK